MEVGIILMGGTGQRLGGDVPKQFRLLGNAPIYRHTVQRFLESNLFSCIVLVCHPAWMQKVREETAEQDVVVIAGGATRQESSRLGLRACPAGTTTVVIHDAVRPFVSPRILQDNIEMAKKHGAADTCIPSADTIVRSEDGEFLSEIPLRRHLWRGQTPQSFAYDLICRAHRTTQKLNSSDDCSLVLEMKSPVALVLGDEANIKITTETDLQVAEAIFSLRECRT